MTRPSMLSGIHPVGASLAVAAGVLQGIIASRPTNDDFHHMVLARQLRAGDWPVRDFFDSGLGLMYALSAIVQSMLGEILLSEALIVGVMLAVSTYLVFALVRRLTESTVVAALSAVLLVVAGPRGYSYPKIIVYAAAATLWWAYVRQPGRARAVALGVWTAVAFYWRPDHGAYVAVGAVLAFVAAHGLRPIAAIRSIQAGAMTLALVAPFLVYASAAIGFGNYVRSGFVMADAQHSRMDGHSWPAWPVRRLSDVFRLDDAEEYAPTVGLRWTESSAPEARQAVIDRYALTLTSTDGRAVQVRLSRQGLSLIRPLINEPIVEDTAGIDRSTGTLLPETWSTWQRRQFDHRWLRFRVWGGVDELTRAGEAVATLFYALPVMLLIASLLLPRNYLPDMPRLSLAAFAVFGMVANFGLMRTPYYVRAVDGVVLPAIAFGVCAAAAWRAALEGVWWRKAVFAIASIAFAMLLVKSVAVVGEFGTRVTWLAGDWASFARARGAWAEVREQLTASPPLRYWDGHRSPVPIELARYAHECVPASERLLVLWFAPEIYYYADRLMAPRHLVFVPGYAQLGREQQMTLSKIERFSPPIAFANSGLDGFTKEVYPAVVEYVHREYDMAGSLEGEGERYVILARRDRPAVRSYGDEHWPCYA